MTHLYALCRPQQQLIVKRVQITQPVQAKIEGIFHAQAGAFLDGVEEEIEFGTDWKPDSDEILVMNAPEETNIIIHALDGNPVALPTLNAANFQGENIKALFTAIQNGHRRILIQLFTAQQILARRFSLLLDGDTFKELTEPAFTLDNYLAAIVEDGKLKFKSFFNVKRIFHLTEIYREATDQEIVSFCGHDSIEVHDVDAFKGLSDQIVRKLVHAVTQANILGSYTVPDIAQKAASLGITLDIANDKIVMPADRKTVKQILRFLDDGIYQAPLTAKRYITNSKRPLA